MESGFPGGAVVKNLPAIAGNTRHGLNPWVGKIPWGRKWQPMPVFLPGKSHGPRILATMGLQRVGHDLVTKQKQHKWNHTACH